MKTSSVVRKVLKTWFLRYTCFDKINEIVHRKMFYYKNWKLQHLRQYNATPREFRDTLPMEGFF